MDTKDAAQLAWLRSVLESGVARSIRVSNRLSLGNVAEPTGLDRSAISRYERGLRRPRPSPAVSRYADLLHSLLNGSR